MKQSLPPLKSVYYFESAARLLSFTLAAQELCVTQAAISHQIKQLEEQLNVKLFHRLTRRLELTDAGKLLYPSVHESFRILHSGFEKITPKEQSNRVTLSLTPALAAKWLVLRLNKFWHRHPEIDLRLHHSIDLVDFEKDDVDIAIRWGAGHWPGLDSLLLLSGEMTPVCSPLIQQGKHPIRTASDLQHHVLLHEDSRADWQRWLVTEGEKNIDASKGPIMDDSSTLMLAAAHSQGIALGRRALISEDVASGRLVCPLPTHIQSTESYHIVTPKHLSHNPNIEALKTFLLSEAQLTSTLP